ncbi:hypothetical protein GE061_012696 [Apolygus lucorum]|uniref:SCP domain-containing protein n=1 Tax=Apolygus lucorum TaxID=248454 RepID=A0A8S9XX32_APOLU|nr:hypothetical protein GE061_012696 [Apolygus lucorum]
MNKLLVIASSFSVVVVESFTRSHCDITCEPDLKHTMCIFTSANKNCENLAITPIDEIKEEILLWHNDLRSEFLGKIPDTLYPPGTSLKMLRWDSELAQMASRWASQCEPTNDRCRRLSRFEVGQNVGLQIGNEHPPSSLQTFAEWAKPMDPKYGGSRRLGTLSKRKILERFFQLISVDTYLIGCAEATYSRSDLKHRLLVCNYAPAAETDMTQLYEAALAIREAFLIKSRRMELEKLRNFIHDIYEDSSFLQSADYDSDLNWLGSDSKFGQRTLTDEDREGSGVDDDYCKINCNGARHVMCTSEKEGSPSCNVERWIDESILKDCVVNKLNDLRNTIAGGLPPLPEASDMRMMKWDEELANLAGKWALQCSSTPDSCRDVERFPVNQLVMVGVSTELEDESHCPLLLEGVSRLIYLLDDNVIQSYSVASDDFLRFLTQAIWSRSAYVGCAEVLFRLPPTGEMTLALKHKDAHLEQFSSLVCNFGEGGNLFNQQVYQPGDSCTNCPQGTSCTDPVYRNLCVGDSPYQPQGTLSGARGLDEDSGYNLTANYCNITCEGKPHVMCGPVVEPTSCNRIQMMDDSVLRKCIVSSLNGLRNRVAEGNFSLPTAADMRMLIWDRELADLARRWAARCPEGIDDCRDVDRFPVNQIMMHHVSSEIHDKSRCADQMKALANLLTTLTPNFIGNYQLSDQDPLRLVTQSIWSKSHRIGCAEVLLFRGWGLDKDYPMPDDFDDHSSQHSSLICNFGERVAPLPPPEQEPLGQLPGNRDHPRVLYARAFLR